VQRGALIGLAAGAFMMVIELWPIPAPHIQA